MSRCTGIRNFISEGDLVVNEKGRTNSLGMKKVEAIGYLTEIGPNHVRGETVWVTFYEFEEIGWGGRFHVDWGNTWHDKVIIVDVFEKVEQWADVGVALDL